MFIDAMTDASQFPITELFGCQPGYPLNKNLCPPGQGYHNGIDYGCPSGTNILVNGIVIGISGSTGAVTGPHLHVGRWVGGQSTNPGIGKGFKFNNAIVTEINEDPIDGKYVRVQADGASWVFLHMSNNSKVRVGQVLQGEDMSQVDELSKLAEARLAEANLTRPAVYLPSRTDTNSEADIRNRVTLVRGDVDNLLKDVGITPTQADYDALKGGPKDFVYYLQARLKAAPKGNFVPVGNINGKTLYEEQ